ncbi:MAG: Rrf2 family transcriptional regulator [Phycisphaerae bacterium]|nr:Rrf2 family transcriptional regulator [Phycisphaerae bacterium]
MNILRQNSDYALRAMVNLAERYDSEVISTRQLSKDEDIAYPFAAKILQKLAAAGLVTSTMGPHGGFALSRRPQDISLLDVVGAVQGEVTVNTCFMTGHTCPRQPKCRIKPRIAALQEHIEDYLKQMTLADLIEKKEETSTAGKG